jgi:hypothetical protein
MGNGVFCLVRPVALSRGPTWQDVIPICKSPINPITIPNPAYIVTWSRGNMNKQ